LVDELVALYPAHAAGRSSPLSPLPFQYADFARWQRATLQGEELERALSWWQAALRGPLPLLQVPLDRPRPALPTWNGTRHAFSLSRESSAAVRRRAQQEGVTPFMFLLAAWAAVLGSRSGQQDLLIGSPSDDRNGLPDGTAGLIGLFVNVLPLRVSLSGLSTTRDLLHHVRGVVTGAFEHPPPPLDLLVQELLRRGVCAEPPVLRTGLTYYSEPFVPRSLGDVKLAPLSVGTRTSHFELALAVSEGEALQASIEYNTDLFAEGTIAALAQDVVRACEEMSAPAPPSTNRRVP
jgi:non-ribosomal peptide synthetase component F